MIKFKSKAIISIAVAVLMIFTMQLTVYATNEQIEIVQKGTQEYIIYVKNNLNNNFKFAFSNNALETEENLVFKNAAEDSTEEGANKIAYINDVTLPMFTNKTYMWVKNDSDVYVIEGVEVDLKQSITANGLNAVSSITKTIPVDTTKTNTTEKTVGDKKVVTTVGKVILSNPGTYEYVLVKAEASQQLIDLTNLAKKISKFNSTTDMYSKVATYREFLSLANVISSEYTEEDWQDVENNEIEQPKEAEDGEQYVLWINRLDTNEQDVQFLTSVRKETIEKIVEKITTRLPVTYDNNTLLIILAVLVVLAVAVSIRIKVLNKKQTK